MTRLPVTWELNRPSPRKLVTSALPAITLNRAGSSPTQREVSVCDAEQRLEYEAMPGPSSAAPPQFIEEKLAEQW
jgi:hypothetical protein